MIKSKIMDLESAIKILKLHNKWRRDETGEVPQMQPKAIGEAIDYIVLQFDAQNLPEISLDEAEKLAMETDYACFATEETNEINTADAGAFFLEGYEYARKLTNK